jgi:hypothetical protein
MTKNHVSLLGQRNNKYISYLQGLPHDGSGSIGVVADCFIYIHITLIEEVIDIQS